MAAPLLVTDVHYHDRGGARAAGLTAAGWKAAEPDAEWTVDIADVEPYEPGAFYRRELPCLLALLEHAAIAPGVIVVDGHAWLGDRPGLGAHLHQATGIPVVGIAKHRFHGGRVAEILRGGSRVPLFVSTAGYPLDEACAQVRAMHGAHRLPTLLTRVDGLARRGKMR